ncbi:hypothetical protein ACSBR1_027431 [Camellia fascicularis]
MWTSSNKKRGFTVVIGHYINDSWTLKSRVMRYIFLLSPFELYSHSYFICLVYLCTFSSPHTKGVLYESMASRMLEKLDYYWKVINGIIGVAAVLDPRYKIKLLKWFYPKIYGVQAFEEIEKIRVICCNLLEEYNLKLMVKEARSSCVNSSSSRTENSQSTIKDSLSSFDLFVSSGSRASVNVKLELDHYIENGVSPSTTDFDILSRWRTNGLKYPTLQLIARDVLAILVSTMGSESAFSTSGRLLSPHHSRLHPKTLEALMCAQNWLWSEIKGSSPMSKDSTIQTILDDYDDHGEESVTAKLDE